jgi:hypothetical protein
VLTGPGPPDSGAIADVVMEFDADEAVDGHRTKPDGKDLAWKQIGVLGTL